MIIGSRVKSATRRLNSSMFAGNLLNHNYYESRNKFSQILLIEEVLSEENPKKSALVKMLVASALQEFNAQPGYKDDLRMLCLWNLLVCSFLYYYFNKMSEGLGKIQ